MHLTSPYPPIPDLPSPTNYYSFLVDRPEVKKWPNYTVYIDGMTGKSIRLRPFFDRVDMAATGLAASGAIGGLGLRSEDGHSVGLLSENCMVSTLPLL
jgi:hypothetical protein